MNLMRNSIPAIVLVLSGSLYAAPVLHASDFIDDESRTHFNGFEGLTDFQVYPVYVEDGIKVEQINPNPGPSIWSTYLDWGAQGSHAWYPNGGNFGYTRISFDDGSDFINAGLIYGSGGNSSVMIYELYNDNQLVLNGVLQVSNTTASYVGFSGGGFDEIHLKDYYSFNNTFNSLAIDNIETSGLNDVAEPSVLLLLIPGLIFFASLQRKFKKA